jgi:peptidoglycan hydrolase-like protein with peptidoglycan-binding domain
MQNGPDTRDAEALAGAMYFVVGRGTEGGPTPFKLSVAGVTDGHWGEVSKVIANSGYSIGTIQVDLGQRGTWGLGKTTGPASPGETTYVDAVIAASSAHASVNGLPYSSDKDQLRADLLSHGDGKGKHSSINFIDSGTKSSIDSWASSSEGKKWIHANIDYPQIKDATETATKIVDQYGAHISDEHRLATIALLMKTENQLPSQVATLRNVLKDGGDYDAVVVAAQGIKDRVPSYAGLDAIAIAENYKHAFSDPACAEAVERAQIKVSKADYDPSHERDDSDVREALGAIGISGRAVAAPSHGSMRLNSRGESVAELQSTLIALSVTDAHGRTLVADGHFGAATKSAVEKFQSQHGLVADGVVGARTKEVLNSALDQTRRDNLLSLSDDRHPGASMYAQALEGVRSIDTQFGRQTDQSSCQLAGALAVGACSAGFNRVDHVVMSDDGSRAYAVQGQLNSPFKQYTEVNVAQAVTVPLEQSGAQFLQASQQREQQAALQPQAQMQSQSQEAQATTSHPSMGR